MIIDVKITFSRSLTELLDCYADIQSRIRAECSQPGVDEFKKNNVRPLVDETKPFVVENCPRMAPQNGVLYGLISEESNANYLIVFLHLPSFLFLITLSMLNVSH